MKRRRGARPEHGRPPLKKPANVLSRKAQNVAVHDCAHVQAVSLCAVDCITRSQGGSLLRAPGLTATLENKRNRILRHIVRHQALPNAQMLDTAVPPILAGQRFRVWRRVPSQPVSQRIFHLWLRPEIPCSSAGEPASAEPTSSIRSLVVLSVSKLGRECSLSKQTGEPTPVLLRKRSGSD